MITKTWMEIEVQPIEHHIATRDVVIKRCSTDDSGKYVATLRPWNVTTGWNRNVCAWRSGTFRMALTDFVLDIKIISMLLSSDLGFSFTPIPSAEITPN